MHEVDLKPLAVHLGDDDSGIRRIHLAAVRQIDRSTECLRQADRRLPGTEVVNVLARQLGIGG